MNSAKWFGIWLLNSLIATIGVAVTVGVLIFSTRSLTTRAMRMYSLSGLFYPLPIVVGLLVGFFSHTRVKGSYRYWAWVGPAILLLASLLSWKTANHASWVEAISHFFVPLPYPGGPDQIGTPVLLYMSTAYSLGAFSQTKLQNWIRFFRNSHLENSGS